MSTTATPSTAASAERLDGRRLSRAERGRIANDVRLACMRISRRVRFESADAVAPHQYSVLMRIAERPHTPRELATIEKVSAPSMTRTVAALVGLGLAERADDPDDGRKVIVSATAEGRRVVHDTRRRRDEWLCRRMAGLPDADVEVLRRAGELLARMAAE